MTNKEEIRMLRKEIELLRKDIELMRLSQPVFIPQPYPVLPSIPPFQRWGNHGNHCACPQCIGVTFTKSDRTIANC